METKLFGGIPRDFCWDILEVPQELKQKKFVFNSRPLNYLGRTARLLERVFPGNLHTKATQRIWDVSGILLGCPGPLAVFKKFVQTKFVRFFVP